MKKLLLLLLLSHTLILSLTSCSSEDTDNQLEKINKFKLDDNQVTIYCVGCELYEIGEVRGKKYIAVDKNYLRNLISSGEDLNSFNFIPSNVGLNGESVENVSVCTSLITDLEGSFGEIIGDISSWDVSNVTNLNSFFSGSNSNYNLNSWDVSSVTTMVNTFGDSNFNGYIDNWNLSSLLNMDYTFLNSNLGVNVDISKWNTSKVTSMSRTFQQASLINSSISNWDVSSVKDMSFMFFGSTFNGDIGNWDVGNVNNMRGMFATRNGPTPLSVPFYNLFNKDISSWDVSNVTDMESMFHGNINFNQNLSQWNVCNVTNIINFSKNTFKWELPKPNFNCN